MTLVILHYHLRPGGIRRVLELAAPYLVRGAPRPVTQVILATGQSADSSWHDRFARALPGVSVAVVVEPAFNYLSEQTAAPGVIATRIRRALTALLGDAGPESHVVWAHNLGVGRNLILSREVAAICSHRGLPLVSHHHDWWFENRWARWPAMRLQGFRTLASAAQAVFPRGDSVMHAAINQADAAVLSSHLGRRSTWLPNLAERGIAPAPARVRAAKQWLRSQLSQNDYPVWILPCRMLRRKNVAEALLLTRWLRPEASLVVTGAASSAEEAPYFRAIERAAREHHWRLRLGILAGDEARKPTVAELLAASETALLTSVQEGFGLPYLEAAAAQRPLIARRLPNIAPDLAQFGFRFPQAYDDLLIAPELFDRAAEQDRQRKLFARWLATMPGSVRRRIAKPALLTADRSEPVAFSRLTLTAQLEVLAQPTGESWAACEPLNPFLTTWRGRSQAGMLQISPWPRQAQAWLSGRAYAQKFYHALATLARAPRPGWQPPQLQADFIGRRLDARNLHPILWSKDS